MSNEGLDADHGEFDADPPVWRPTAWQWGWGVSLLMHALGILLMLGQGESATRRADAAVLSVRLLAPRTLPPAAADTIMTAAGGAREPAGMALDGKVPETAGSRQVVA